MWNVKIEITDAETGEYLVLIETLWNVKVSADCLYLSAVPVLIETLWNVKIFPDVSEISASFGINRNIVECKAKTLGRIWICLEVLIETLWNVKRIAIRSSFFACKVLIETLWNVKISDNVYVRV